MKHIFPKLTRLAALWAAILLLSLQAEGIGVGISVKVDGVNRNIGTLDASVPDNTQPARVISEFLLNDWGKILDQCYDFQWVNVERKYTVDGKVQAQDPITGKLPAIDPQPSANEDNIPWYFNNKEWTAGVFDGVTIHDEGKASRFVDRPRDGNKNSQIEFMTFLVVEPIKDTGMKKTDFCVIGWFDWTYDNMSDFTKGVSSVGTVSSVVDTSMIDLINAAMGNAGGGGFPKYKALQDCDLVACPEGDAFWAAGAIFAMALVGRRGLASAKAA